MPPAATPYAMPPVPRPPPRVATPPRAQSPRQRASSPRHRALLTGMPDHLPDLAQSQESKAQQAQRRHVELHAGSTLRAINADIAEAGVSTSDTWHEPELGGAAERPLPAPEGPSVGWTVV